MLSFEELAVLNEQVTEPEACAIRFVNYQRLLEEQKVIVTKQVENEALELDLQSKFLILGGLSRSNLFNLDLYSNHIGASKFLLGFDTFEEYVVHVKCFDDEIDTDLERFKGRKMYVNLVVNKFEKITLTIMKFRRNMTDGLLSYIWGLDITSIHRYVKFAAPIIGLWGAQLCDLDTPESFFVKEQVESYILLGEQKIACQVDGKDYACFADRGSNLLKRSMFSNKEHCSAFRGVSYTAKTGLAFHHTSTVLGGASETALVANEGSYRGNFLAHKEVDVIELGEQLEPAGGELGDEDDDNSPCAVEEVKEEEDVVENAVMESLDQGDDGDEDGANIEETLGEEESDDERSEEEAIIDDILDNDESMETIQVCEDIQAFFKERMDQVDRSKVEIAEEQRSRSKRKEKPLITVNDLKTANKVRLIGEVNKNEHTKLRQLLHHNRLDEKYISGELKRKTLLSFYLQSTREYRAKLIAYLQANTEDRERLKDQTVFVSGCLGKIPPGWKILADRGFWRDGILYPHLNEILFPHFIHKREQFESEEISTDRKICQLRYTCEVAFSRVTDINAIAGVIPYRLFPYVEHIVNWGHANVNLGAPLQNPMNWNKHLENEDF